MPIGFKSELCTVALSAVTVAAAPFLGLRGLLYALPVWAVGSRLLARGSRNLARPPQSELDLLQRPALSGRRRPVAIVTGTNSGIGYHTAVALAAEGYEVVITCRSAVLTLQTAEQIEAAAQARRRERPGRYGGAAPEDVRVVGQLPLECDDFASVRAFAAWVAQTYADRPVKILVNNAGGMRSGLCYSAFNPELELHTAANFLGPLLLTELLLPVLERTPGSRVVYVSSAAHRNAQVALEDGGLAAAFSPSVVPAGRLAAAVRDLNRGTNSSGPLHGYSVKAAFSLYGVSKLLNIYHAHVIARRYQKQRGSGGGVHRVYACSLHPGCIASNFQKDLIHSGVLNAVYKLFGLLYVKTPEEGAQTTLHCALCPIEELELVEPAAGKGKASAQAVAPYFVECRNQTAAFLSSYGWDIKEAEEIVAWGKKTVGLPA